MGKVIVLGNLKGGVSKTTSTINISHGLANLGKRVLVIDCDPQANTTISFGYDPFELDDRHRTLYHSLVLGQIDFPSLILAERNPALVPASLLMTDADEMMMSRTRYSDVLLRSMIAEVKQDYDFILIDTSPSLGILTKNALVAADYALIPVKCDRFSAQGVSLFFNQIEEKVVQRSNRNLKIIGILPTIYYQNQLQDNHALDKIRASAEKKNIHLFRPIPKSTNYDISQWSERATIDEYPQTPGIDIYKEIADHISHL